VSKLKQGYTGRSSLPAASGSSARWWRTTWVDELRLMIDPVVLDAGERLFAATSDQRPVRPVETRTVDDLACLAYEVD
jgi:dihydrofolate reductase